MRTKFSASELTSITPLTTKILEITTETKTSSITTTASNEIVDVVIFNFHSYYRYMYCHNGVTDELGFHYVCKMPTNTNTMFAADVTGVTTTSLHVGLRYYSFV